MGRRVAFRRKPVPLRPCAHGGNRDGHIWRAKGGRPGFRNAAPCRIRQHREGDDVGILALISRHALRRVAFHMLNTAEIFLHGQSDVFHMHIILKIEPFSPFAIDLP